MGSLSDPRKGKTDAPVEDAWQLNQGAGVPSYDLSALSILVVDDNKNMRMLICQVLMMLNVRRVREAEDGAAALKVLQETNIDIIITDWMMEPLDGLELTQMVRTATDSSNPFVPIIMLTGHTEIIRVQEARDAGVNEFLAKPISAKAIYDKLVNVISRPRIFVRSPAYAGPDRRRSASKSQLYRGSERRKDAEEDGVFA